MTSLRPRSTTGQIDSLISEISAYEVVISDPAAKAALSHLKSLAVSMKNELIDTDPSAVPSPHPSGSRLTARESEILRSVMNGDTNKEIAYMLSISPRTVQFHLNSIFNKTTTNTRTGAVTVALKNGWL